MKKELLSGFVSLCLIVSLLGIGVRVNAAESDHHLGDFIITYDDTVGEAVYDGVEKIVRISGKGSYTISMDPAAPNPSTQGITLMGVGDITLTLKDVKINRSGENDKCAFLNSRDGQTTLILEGNNKLESGNMRAGVEMHNNHLIIQGPGTLIAVGGSRGAGIGGGADNDGSNIRIDGGTVTALGHDGGAGIGGGTHGNGNNITISGGAVTATGNSGAGIGGGYQGGGSTIAILGGTVFARGMDEGKDIGGGGGSIAPSLNNKILGGSIDARKDKVDGLPDNSPKEAYVYTLATKPFNKVTELEGPGGVQLNNTENSQYGEKDIFTDNGGQIYLWHVENSRKDNTMRIAGQTWKSDADGNLILAPALLPKLGTPENLTWDLSVPGMATWLAVADAKSYSIQLYKDNVAFGAEISSLENKQDFIATMMTEGAGNYRYKVKAVADPATHRDSMWSIFSPNQAFNRPPLAAPGDLRWDDVIKGKALWSAVAKASRYRVQLYKNGHAIGPVLFVSDPERDFTEDIKRGGPGDYYFAVLAEGDPTTHGNSFWSVPSPIYTVKGGEASPHATQGGVPIENIKDVVRVNEIERVAASTSDQKKTDAANQAKTAAPATAAAKSPNQQLPATGSSEAGVAVMVALALVIAGWFIYKKK